MNVLIVAHEDERPESLQRLRAAANLPGADEIRVTQCILSRPANGFGRTAYISDKIILCKKEDCRPWEAAQVRSAVRDIMQTKPFPLVLLGNHYPGAQAAVCLACDTDGESILNASCAKVSKGELMVTKAVYASNMNAVYRIKKTPCFMTLGNDTDSQVKLQIANKPVIAETTYNFTDSESMIYLSGKKIEQNMLQSAKSVVIAGRGIRNKQDLALAEKFAGSIGAELGGSRPLVMNGLLPTERMIGQSGKIIAPNLCIAIGVSGAAPLAAGIQQSKKIIAVNQDREAPIFKIADLGIVADYHKVLARVWRG